MRREAARLPDGQWVMARQQTAGRGRQGRAWAMAEGNLAASCLVRPRSGEGARGELGFVVGLALREAMLEFAPAAGLCLKWPNDLLLDGAKLAGVLLESEADFLILGVGVNLASAPEVPGRATAALADIGVAVTPDAAISALAEAFTRWRSMWARQGFSAIRRAWCLAAHPVGTPLAVNAGGTRISGAFAGLAEDGALLLDGSDGGRHVVHAGDVWQG